MADIGTTDRQISLPFAFGPDGGVTTTTVLAKQIADHVYSAVGTQQGERVMASAYGTNIMPHLFGSVDDVTEQEITQTISDALTLNAPEVSLQSVTYVASPGEGSIDLEVHYSLSSANGSVSTGTVPISLGT